MSGSVFGWGKNSCGQLGLGHTRDIHTPTTVQCLNMKRTIDISCGMDHTAILTKGGTVLTFGSGQYGQLGHNSLRDELRPRVVAELWGAKVTKIACARHHTLVLTDTKRIYSFGRGKQGQLGNGDKSDQSVPQAVQLSEDATAHQQIGQIFAGGNLSFALCSTEEGLTDLGAGNVEQEALEDMIDNWTSECDSNHWRKIQKEIKRTFSSESCLNRSFLEKCGGRHFQTSSKYSGLNLKLARRAFKKLVGSDKVFAEVESVLRHNLLPSLCEKPVGVEGLRVYLLLTELLSTFKRKKEIWSTELMGAVAAAMLRLPRESLQVLGDWWSSLKRSTMIEHVHMWKQGLAWLLVSGPLLPNNTAVKDLLKVIRHFYNVNKTAGSQKVEESTFCLEEIFFNPVFLAQNVTLWRSWSGKKDVNETPVILCRFPFVMNLQCKIMVFDISADLKKAQHQQTQMQMMYPLLFQPSAPYFEMHLRRASLVEDTFQKLDAVSHSTFKKPLEVYFDGDLKHSDVYKRDFFHHLFDELLRPESEMFTYNDSNILAWFPSEAVVAIRRYFLFGVICGLALYNQCIIHLPFPMAVYKKLVGVEPSLEDLKEFSPHVGESLRVILEDYDDDDIIEELDTTFAIFWDGKNVELDNQHPGKLVTSKNKKEFVDAYVDFVFNKSVEEVFKEFQRGFFEVCDLDVVKLFRPEELKGLAVGKENYDWEKLKQNTVYESPYHADHPNIIMFWEVFDKLTEDQKKAFLLFLTGYDRVPILGMDQVRMTVRVLLNASQQHFPEALTCHSILDLPVYSTKQTLEARLVDALSHNRGFVTP